MTDKNRAILGANLWLLVAYISNNLLPEDFLFKNSGVSSLVMSATGVLACMLVVKGSLIERIRITRNVGAYYWFLLLILSIIILTVSYNIMDTSVCASEKDKFDCFLEKGSKGADVGFTILAHSLVGLVETLVLAIIYAVAAGPRNVSPQSG